nr:hypothetical protein [Pirellulimonas nuda]
MDHAALVLFRLGEVAQNACEESAISQPELAYCKIGWKLRPASPSTDDFSSQPDDPLFAGSQVVLQVRVVLSAEGRGHEHRDVLPDYLVGSVAKHPAGGQIRRVADAAMVDRDDRVDSRVENRLETRFIRAIAVLRNLSAGHSLLRHVETQA